MSTTKTGIIAWLRQWFDDIYALKSEIPSGNSNFDVDEVYPVGSIYITVDEWFSPREAFGGTWERISGKFLFATDSTSKYPSGATGGEENHTLTVNEMPSHTHTQNPHNHTQNQHRHAMDAKFSNSSGSSTSYTGTSKRNETTRYTDYQTPAINNQTATNQNTGGGQAHNNMPPYLVVNMWKRTA